MPHYYLLGPANNNIVNYQCETVLHNRHHYPGQPWHDRIGSIQAVYVPCKSYPNRSRRQLLLVCHISLVRGPPRFGPRAPSSRRIHFTNCSHRSSLQRLSTAVCRRYATVCRHLTNLMHISNHLPRNLSTTAPSLVPTQWSRS